MGNAGYFFVINSWGAQVHNPAAVLSRKKLWQLLDRTLSGSKICLGHWCRGKILRPAANKTPVSR